MSKVIGKMVYVIIADSTKTLQNGLQEWQSPVTIVNSVNFSVLISPEDAILAEYIVIKSQLIKLTQNSALNKQFTSWKWLLTSTEKKVYISIQYGNVI